ncbi:hypothetical protein [uncultured Aeromicrobium sp.]|uniref:hypothetical protein n=1 Tax=uncultured Aeromicrobium sp. TaxID=337820 RepID=UPI0025FC6C64|nr:hypothetical protein [uncultured Aeromicrobium sp.]
MGYSRRRGIAAVIEPVIRADECRAVLDRIHQVYDIQCPTLPRSAYQPGAHSAHRWWERVLGSTLEDLRRRADKIEQETR